MLASTKGKAASRPSNSRAAARAASAASCPQGATSFFNTSCANKWLLLRARRRRVATGSQKPTTECEICRMAVARIITIIVFFQRRALRRFGREKINRRRRRRRRRRRLDRRRAHLASLQLPSGSFRELLRLCVRWLAAKRPSVGCRAFSSPIGSTGCTCNKNLSLLCLLEESTFSFVSLPHVD